MRSCLFGVIAVFVLLTSASAAERSIDPSKLSDKITLPLGRKILVEFEQHGNVLSRPRVVKAPTGKASVVLFDFQDRGGNIWILTIKNAFPKTFRFRALAHPKGQSRLFETSILPVFPGLVNFESWHEPFSELILFDFKLTDETIR